MSTTYCPKCGGTLVPVGERKGGYSVGKAAVGAFLVGPVGLIAGALGKKRVTLCCDNCGYTLETGSYAASEAQRAGAERMQRMQYLDSLMEKLAESERIQAELDEIARVKEQAPQVVKMVFQELDECCRNKNGKGLADIDLRLRINENADYSDRKVADLYIGGQIMQYIMDNGSYCSDLDKIELTQSNGFKTVCADTRAAIKWHITAGVVDSFRLSSGGGESIYFQPENRENAMKRMS